MSASASHADAPTLDETVAEVHRTFREARAHTAVKRGEAAAALQEVEAQIVILQNAYSDPIGFLMGKHFPEGSPVRVDIETAMEGIPIETLQSVLHEQVSAPGYAESRATELAAITQKKNEIIQSIAEMDAAIAGLTTQEAETEQQLASVRALLQNQNQGQSQAVTAGAGDQ